MMGKILILLNFKYQNITPKQKLFDAELLKNKEIIYLYKMRSRDEDLAEHAQKDGLLLKEIRYRSFTQLLLMVLNICLSPFYFGYSIQYLGTFQFKNIIQIFNITMSEELAKGLYNACVPIGGGIGALTSFFLLKNLSRKKALLFVNAIALVFGIVLMIPNQYTFLFARLMQGVCVGFYSAIAPLIIKEFAPIEIAGTLGAFNQLFVAFGVFFSCLLQYIFKLANGNNDDKEKDYWYILFGFTLITVLVQTILLLVVYRFETPRYLLEKGKQKQCEEVIRWIYLDEYVLDVMNQKKKDLGMTATSSLVSVDSAVQVKRQQRKRNKLRFAVAIHLALIQQFVGINAVVIYGTDIAASVFENLKNLIPVIMNLEQTLTCLVTSYLLTKLGRKQILQGGTAVGIASLILIGSGFLLRGGSDHPDDTTTTTIGNVMILIGLVVFMADFGLSLGPVVWLYIPEILEPDLIPFSTGANWGAATLITILFPILKSAFGTPAPLFLFYAAYCLLGFLFSQKYVIETKGKSQKEIYDEYEKLTQ